MWESHGTYPAMTAGEECPAVVETRWVGADDEPGAGHDEASALNSASPGGGYFEAEVSLPGVTGATDIVAEIVTRTDPSGRSLCVRASTGDGVTSYVADVPLPDGCDHDEIARVKWSKKRSTLRVRFAAHPVVRGGTDAGVGVAGGEEDADGPLAEYLKMLGVRDDGEEDGEGSEPELEEDGDASEDEPRDETPAMEPGDERRTENPERTNTPFNAKAAPGNKKKRRKAKAKGTITSLALPKSVSTTTTRRSVADLADTLAAQLNHRGFASAQFITRDAVCVCREEIKRIAPLYTDGEIWLGKKDAGAQIAVKSVRGDRVFWMDQPTVNGGNFSAMREMLRAIDSLVLDHMSRLVPARLGRLADRTHAMLAEYPGRKSRFVRHVDNTGRDGRRLTVLCYLNPDYTGEHGGALKVYEPDDEDGTRGVEVAPSGGTIAMFYADQTPHEVLPSLRSRHSFTVWYYDDFEWKDAETRRGEAAAADSRAAHMPRVDGDAASSPAATLAAQDASDQEAQGFVRLMMTQRLTPARAVNAARGLSPRALRTVGTVFGAPDPQSFIVALTQMSQSDLDELRMEITSMGMDNAPDAELA